MLFQIPNPTNATITGQFRIVLNALNCDFTIFGTNGLDMQVTDSGTAIPFWRKSFSAANQVAELWVKATVPAGGKTITIAAGAVSDLSSYDATMQKIPNDDPGLLGLYHLDDTSTTSTPNSASGAASWGGNMTLTNNPARGTTDGGACGNDAVSFATGHHLILDGTQDAHIGDALNKFPAHGTVMFWVKRTVDTLTPSTIMEWRTSYPDPDESLLLTFSAGGDLVAKMWHAAISGGLASAGWAYNSCGDAWKKWPVGEWHHIAFTWDGTNTFGYIDGTLWVCLPGVLTNGTYDGLSFGGTAGHNGQGPLALDEIAIYNRFMTRTEIQNRLHRRADTSTTSIYEGLVRSAANPLIATLGSSNHIAEPDVFTGPDGKPAMVVGVGYGIELYKNPSGDMLTWVHDSTIIGPLPAPFGYQVMHPKMQVKNGVYYLFGILDTGSQQLVTLSSTDLITWTSPSHVALSNNPTAYIGNMQVIEKDGTDYLFLELGSLTDGLYLWQVHLYTGSALTGPFTHVQVLDSLAITPVNNFSSPDIHKIGDTYYMFYHYQPYSSASSLGAVKASVDLINWFPVADNPILDWWSGTNAAGVTGQDNAGDKNQAQVADLCLVESSGKTYMYWAAGSDATDTSNVRVSIYDGTMAELVADMGNGARIADPSSPPDPTMQYASITMSRPVAENGNITLYAGDDYLSDDGRAIEFRVTGDHPELIGANMTLVGRVNGDKAIVAGSIFGDIVRFEVLAAVTSVLTAGQASYVYTVSTVDATGHRVTLGRGQVDVI